MPDGKNAHEVLFSDKTIQRDIAISAERNDQFSNIAFDTPTNQRMMRQGLYSSGNGIGSLDGCVGIAVGQKGECALEIDQRIFRINYLRQGEGFGVESPLARRFIQA